MQNAIDTERIAGQLPLYAERHLKKSKAGLYCCPFCDSGNHGNADSDGALQINDKTFYCHACNTSGNIFKLHAHLNGLDDKKDFKRIIEELQNDLGGYTYTPKKPAEKPKIEYTAYYEKSHANIDKVADYLKKRGLTSETIERFKLGYDGERLVIPYNKYSYTGRALNGESPKYKNSKGEIGIFNFESIRTATTPVFIVEGAFDCMSICQCGHNAVALGGLAINKFINALAKIEITQPFIVALDNDTAEQKGQAHSEELTKQLTENGYIVLNDREIYGDCKDANELLQKGGLASALETAVNKFTLEKEREKQAYIESNSVAYYIPTFLREIANRAPAISTGCKNLDKILDGGLYGGLYTIGAISSLGKTTFVLQMADHIATAGHDVMLFSLEMARAEIMAKSISRNTILEAIDNGFDTRNAKSTRAILNINFDNETNECKDLVIRAIERYKKTAGNLYIKQADGQINASNIKEAIREHKEKTGNTPVVFIDYLQLLTTTNDKITDARQTTERNVLLLKQISRDYNTPVFIVSSFSRDNYNEPVNLAGFKESGIIEYSSDVVIGLQYTGMDYEGKETPKSGDRATRIFELLQEQRKRASSGQSQSVQLKVLKNRNGNREDCYFEFYPVFNYFKESTPPAVKSEGKYI